MIFRQGRIPDFIYKVLPYFYLCAGLVTIFLANNCMAVFSGISLILAGIIVCTLRYQHASSSGSRTSSGSCLNRLQNENDID